MATAQQQTDAETEQNDEPQTAAFDEVVDEVKFNAPGYSTYLSLLDESDPLHEKISEKGMMNPVPLTKADLQRLYALGDNIRGSVSWQNARMRVRQAAHDSGAIPN